MKKRDSFLPIAVPDISQDEVDEVVDALRSGWISVGPKVKQFEERFSALHGSKHAVALNSATSALFLVAKGLGIGPGKRVIVPSVTWPSTANIVEQLGAEPVFVDVDRRTGNMTPEIAEEKIRELEGEAHLVIPVHLSGLPVDIEGFRAVSEKYGIPVLYDAAHAVFSEYDGKLVGSFGAASVFSFYAIKNVTTGDGGMITTDDDDLAEYVSLWAYHGMSKDAWKRYSKEGSSPHVQSIVPGFKFNMTDLNAALGLAQLGRFGYLRDRRNELVRHYDERFRGVEGIETPVFETGRGKWGNHVYGVRLLDERIDRDRFMEKLREYRIGTNVHFYPVHLHHYYREKYPELRLPHSEWLGERLVSLPLCTRHDESDLDYVVDVVKYLLDKERF